MRGCQRTLSGRILVPGGLQVNTDLRFGEDTVDCAGTAGKKTVSRWWERGYGVIKVGYKNFINVSIIFTDQAFFDLPGGSVGGLDRESSIVEKALKEMDFDGGGGERVAEGVG